MDGNGWGMNRFLFRVVRHVLNGEGDVRDLQSCGQTRQAGIGTTWSGMNTTWSSCWGSGYAAALEHQHLPLLASARANGYHSVLFLI